MRGEKSRAEVAIRTVRPGWERTLEATIWTQGLTESLILVTAPQREKGTVFLRTGEEMYNYVPAIKKVVLLPAAMMQSWMGTDFSNDALVNTGSLVEDYDHAFLADRTINGTACKVIELTPKPESAVVWGKIELFLGAKDGLQRRAEFYDEEGYLISTLEASDIKTLGGRTLPTRIKMIPAEEEGMFTELIYRDLDFSPEFPPELFTKAYMKHVQ